MDQTKVDPVLKARAELRSRCAGLAALIAETGNSFAKRTINNRPRPPANPMSGSELRAKVNYRIGENAGGLLSATAKMAPGGGLFIEAIGYFGDVHQTGQDFQQWGDHPLKAGLSAGFFGNSTLLFVNAWREGRGLTPLLTRTTAHALKRAGVAGAILMGLDVVGPPLIEYAERNAEIPAISPEQFRYEWEGVGGVGASLRAWTAEFMRLGCGDVLNGQ